MTVEHMKTWRIGRVEITRLVEVWKWEDDIGMALDGGKPSQVLAQPWLLPHHATPEGRMFINFQAFVLKAGKQRIMIDTCVGADREREFAVFTRMRTTFLEDLASIGITPGDVDTVLCTHLHFDHVGWNTRLVDGRWVPTFPNARYLFSRKEYEHWVMLRESGGYHAVNHLSDSVDPVVAAGLVDFINHDHQISDEIRLLPTPGHTPDHVSVLINSEGEQAVITGDVMHHPIQVAMPAHAATFDMDKNVGAKTRVEFVTRFQEKPVLVIGSHFADPGAGYIVRHGDAWKLNSPH
ncbi:MAG TPA: MBL fold metallo-hydrolase [Steroidobacteraceae bacterium]|jgi:glyoxylase-like metal-dependent hydrolase (beta-lactamase superfamily II)|nr:MBL fold metallo-hydrolase [Steroidobacteraceae bacterium]